MGADYHQASTAEPVEKTLLDYLSSRSRRGRLTSMSWGVLNAAMLVGCSAPPCR